MKSQAVRLADVFLLGPFMIWAGFRVRDPLASALLIAAGGATIGYNWANYERGGNYAPHLHTAECPTGFVTSEKSCIRSGAENVL